MNKKYLIITVLCAVAAFCASPACGTGLPAAATVTAAALTPPPIIEENRGTAPSGPVFIELNVEGIIDVATADYLEKGIALAEKEKDAGVLIVMQTPGGLDVSMRKICGKIFASKVPVITYIYPKGSRAASAGVFILLASHVAAMAEGTNIGTAHPVDFQGHSASGKNHQRRGCDHKGLGQAARQE